MKAKKGFTLMEFIVVIAIFSLLAYLASVSFVKMQKSRLLKDNVWKISSVLRQAQSKAVSGEGINGSHLRFGVLFNDDYYQEFASLTDFSNRQTDYDFVTDLPSSLIFTDFNLPDTCLIANDCIIFSPIEGSPSASGNIKLENQVDSEKKTIEINEQGKVNF